MQTEDGQIIYQCLNGDPAMFGVLVDKYREGIYALAYSKIGNFHDAQDITQEAFIKAFRKLRTLRHWETFALWLSTIANNLCKDFIRARSKRPDRDFVEDQSPDLVDNTSIDSYHNDLVHKSLQEALNSLPEIYRQVITLHYLSGYKSMDIAKLLGVSLRTVTERLRIGRERLKEEMITMIGETFKEQRLSAGFTFRIVEIVKQIKIQPVPTTKGLPWGLSLATGIIIAVLSLNPYIPQLDQFGTISGAPLLSESKVLKVGEIPVDVVKVSNVPILSSKVDKGKGGEPKQPDMQDALFMAPQKEGGEWVEKADMPTARGNISSSACVVNGKIYIMGGADGVRATPEVEEYDPKTDKWAKKRDMPSPRASLATSVVNGKIYVIGGWNGGILATVEEYDPERDIWIKKADMPTPRQFLSTSVVNGKIYAMGGFIAGMIATPIVEEYDPVNNKWIRKADMPNRRAHFASASLNGKIYIFGGGTELNFDFMVIEYDPVKDIWEDKCNMEQVSGALSACALDGKIYILGGMDTPNHCTPTVEEYDPIKNIWKKMSDRQVERADFSTAVFNGKIYAIGGWKPISIPLSSVEEYTPEGWQSAVSPQNKLPRTWGNIKSR